MIKLNNVNKYYYKGEARELHVLNNVSIELPSAGFISILGESGSGKTTLLNVIGGLDKFNDGEIIFNDKVFKNFKNNKEIDEYRKNHIGYIFQNYLLFNNNTVYNNLKIALELIGIKDKKIQKQRIEAALRSVGMINYKKKLVKNLSGGQMQRVSIARALIKDSNVILADEPTGNIDSDNTKIVADLLKELSKTRLVIMVTHEKYLAESYSDYIVNFKDGKIVSFEENILQGDYETSSTKLINIEDLSKEENVLNDNTNISLYYDDLNTLSNIKIILKNNTLYIESDNNLVDVKNSSVKIVNGIKKKEEQPANYNFDLQYEEANNNLSFKEKLNDFFVNAKKLLRGKKKSVVFFRIIYIIIGIIFASTITSLSDLTYVDKTNLLNKDEYYVIQNDKSIEAKDYPINKPQVYWNLTNEGIDLNPIKIDSYYLSLSYPVNFVETKTFSQSYPTAIYNKDLEILAGRKLENDEIMITSRICDDIIDKLEINTNDYNYVLEKINLINSRVSGIVKSDELIVYENALSHNSNYIAYNEFKHLTIKSIDNPSYLITTGSDLLQENDIILSEYLSDDYPLGSTVCLPGYNYDGKTFYAHKIVGYFTSLDTNVNVIANDTALSKYYYSDWSLSRFNIEYTVYLDDDYYTLVDGKKPTGENEVLVSVDAPFAIGDTLHKYHGYVVTGHYKVNDKACVNEKNKLENVAIISLESFIQYNENLLFELSNEDVSKLKDKGFTVKKIYDYQYKQTLDSNRAAKFQKLITLSIMLVVVMLYTYFTARSRMISDIKDIGLYRALGKSKKDIKKQYALYSLLETTISSAVGYIIAIIVGNFINKTLRSMYIVEYSINFLYVIVGLLVLYVLNILIGLLPISTLLHKTPSEILSKYDI